MDRLLEVLNDVLGVEAVDLLADQDPVVMPQDWHSVLHDRFVRELILRSQRQRAFDLFYQAGTWWLITLQK